MSHTFIIIDDNQDDITKTQAIAERFRNLSFLASANTYDEGVNLILEHQLLRHSLDMILLTSINHCFTRKEAIFLV